MSEPAGLTPRAQRIDAQRLRIAGPDPDWNARVRASVLALGAPPSANSWSLAKAEAALSVGEFQLARQLIEGLRAEGAVYLRLIALYCVWTGDLGFLKREWPRAMRWVSALPSSASPTLVFAAEAIGATSDASTLRALAAGAEPNPAPSPDAGPFGPLLTAVRDLKIEPDAPRGRLAMRLALPPSWDWLTIERLRVGDNEVNCRVTRAPGLHHFVFQPVSGPTPLRLVLVLVIAGSGVSSISVGGVPAQLDLRSSAPGQISCPVQLVLDHERVVEIMTQ